MYQEPSLLPLFLPVFDVQIVVLVLDEVSQRSQSMNPLGVKEVPGPCILAQRPSH